jgi:hypothetical protein
LPFIVTVTAGDVPEADPDHPEKTELLSGTAERVTTVQASKTVPGGSTRTVPLPVPVLAVVRV